jgi:hypothetical protein
VVQSRLCSAFEKEQTTFAHLEGFDPLRTLEAAK